MAFSVPDALTNLQRAREQNRLAHAYLLEGGEEARQLAGLLVAHLLGTEEVELAQIRHPLCRLVEPESKSRRILIEQIRQLEHLFQQRAGQIKIGVIAEADRLQPQAANAFLKTLEEPPGESLLLLLSAHPEQLLPTILSRCVRLPLRSAAGRSLSPEAVQWHQDLDAFFARSDAGSLATCFQLAHQFRELVGQLRQRLSDAVEAELKAEDKHYAQATEGDWLARQAQAGKARLEAEVLAQREMLWEETIIWVVEALRQAEGLPPLRLPAFEKSTRALGTAWGVESLLEAIAALQRGRTRLGTNVQEALCVEVTFLQAFGRENASAR